MFSCQHTSAYVSPSNIQKAGERAQESDSQLALQDVYMQYSYIALWRVSPLQCMNQTSQLSLRGEDLFVISCEDVQNCISCSSLDLIIIFAAEEGVRGLGVCGGSPAHRSFPQDHRLDFTASVHWDQAQSFMFPSSQQESSR